MVNHMVNYQPDEMLDVTFKALADPTRRAILERLSEGGTTVTDLARPFDMSLPAISKHLRVLERAGLVTRQRDGRVHRMGLEAEPLRSALGWINRYRRFWEQRFEKLAEVLERGEEEKEPWQRPSPEPKPRSTSAGPSKPPRSGSSRHGPGRKS